MKKEIQAMAEKIVDLFLDGYQYVVLDRNPESVQEPARTYETLTLAVDVKNETIQLETNSRMSGDNAVEAREWHGIVRRFTLASSKEAVRAYDRKELVSAMRDLLPLAKRVLDGGRVEWDGHNHVGVFTEDAEEANDDLGYAIEQLHIDSLDTWAASDYLQEIGVQAWPNGMELDDAVQKIEGDAEYNGIVLVGDLREVLLEFAYDHLRKGGELNGIQLRELLKYRFGVDTNDPVKVADTLYRKADMTAEGIARALKSAFKLSPAEVAGALHNEEGLGLPADDVAWALQSDEGLDLSEEETVRALSEIGIEWDMDE